MIIAGGIALGLLLGYSLQRGGYCMNTAFRSFYLEKDKSLVRAWVLVLLINIVGVVFPDVVDMFIYEPAYAHSGVIQRYIDRDVDLLECGFQMVPNSLGSSDPVVSQTHVVLKHFHVIHFDRGLVFWISASQF